MRTLSAFTALLALAVGIGASPITPKREDTTPALHVREDVLDSIISKTIDPSIGIDTFDGGSSDGGSGRYENAKFSLGLKREDATVRLQASGLDLSKVAGGSAAGGGGQQVGSGSFGAAGALPTSLGLKREDSPPELQTRESSASTLLARLGGPIESPWAFNFVAGGNGAISNRDAGEPTQGAGLGGGDVGKRLLGGLLGGNSGGGGPFGGFFGGRLVDGSSSGELLFKRGDDTHAHQARAAELGGGAIDPANQPWEFDRLYKYELGSMGRKSTPLFG